MSNREMWANNIFLIEVLQNLLQSFVLQLAEFGTSHRGKMSSHRCGEAGH